MIHSECMIFLFVDFFIEFQQNQINQNDLCKTKTREMEKKICQVDLISKTQTREIKKNCQIKKMEITLSFIAANDDFFEE